MAKHFYLQKVSNFLNFLLQYINLTWFEGGQSISSPGVLENWTSFSTANTQLRILAPTVGKHVTVNALVRILLLNCIWFSKNP